MVRRSARLSTSAALLGLCACQLLNPKWDPYGDESEAGSGVEATAEVSTGASASDSGGGSSASSTTSTTSSGSDSASTSAGTTTAGTTAADTSTSATGETGTSTTEDPECQPVDAQCVNTSDCCACASCVDGTCQADVGLSCGECRVCDGDGECVLEAVDAPCGEAIDCAALSCGPDGNGRCRACAGQEHGRCDADGTCVPAEPSGCLDNGEGEIAISCTLSCVKDIQACPQLVAVASLVDSAYCLNDGSITAGCHDYCANEALYSEIRQFRCLEGGCKAKGAAIDCGKYRCDVDTDVCFESCAGNQQCVFAFTCVDNMCVP